MEPTTPQGTGVTPTSSVRRHRTLQAVLLFFLVLLLVLIGATLTGAFGAKTSVSSTNATATAKAGGYSGFASGDGSSVLSNTITALSGTPISLTPGSTGASTDANGNPSGGYSGASTDANGNSTGSNGGSTGSLPGGTNSNPSGASNANGSSTGGSNGATGSSNGGSTGSSTGNGSGLASSLPGGSNSANGSNSSTGANGSSANGSTGANGSATGGSTGGTGSNAAGGNGPTPHLGNYVCTTGEPGNLIYQSDFTLLEGLKYKHSSNPSQEFSFSYDPTTQAIHWLDGPNAGTVGSYYLPAGSQPYRIVEQFPNNPQAAPVSCSLAVTK